MRYRYPAGTLSDDFEPPAWLETASTGCRARVTVLAPTLQDAVTVEGRPLTRGRAFVVHRSGRRRVGAVRVWWVLTAGTFGGAPVVSLSAAIRAPAVLSPYGAVVALGFTADTVAAGAGDRPCPNDARRKAALLRDREAMDSMMRGLTLISPPA